MAVASSQRWGLWWRGSKPFRLLCQKSSTELKVKPQGSLLWGLQALGRQGTAELSEGMVIIQPYCPSPRPVIIQSLLKGLMCPGPLPVSKALIFHCNVSFSVCHMVASLRQLCLSLSDTVTHDHKDGTVEFNWKRYRLFNHTACLVLYQLCMEVRSSLRS